MTKKYLATSALALAFAAMSGGAFAHDAAFDAEIAKTLNLCKQVSPSCAAEVRGAYGILIFPTVTKADFIIGGSGGKGALVEKEHITGYYSLGSGSIGLQAGADQASQVYIFRNAKALANLKSSQDWHAGSDAGVTLVSQEDSSNKKAMTGDVLAYVFDAQGLHGGIAVEAFDIWKTGSKNEASNQSSD